MPGQIDANDAVDVFLFERTTGAVTLVSHAAGSPTSTGAGESVLIGATTLSGDGGVIAFRSHADDLVAGQLDDGGTNPADAFVWERSTGIIGLVSHSAGDLTSATNGVDAVSIAPGGAFATFATTAPDVVDGQLDTNEVEDVFRYERATGETSLSPTQPVHPRRLRMARASPAW